MRTVRRVPLLLWTLPLTAVVVGAIVAAAIGREWALAFVALLAGTAAIAIVTESFLGEDGDTERPPVRDRRRWPAVTLAAIAAAAIVAALLGSRHDDVADATSSAGGAAATQTVRDFLVAAYVDGNGYSACGYLSQGEQEKVAATVPSSTCRDVLNTPADSIQLGALTSSRRVRDLPGRVRLSGGTATVRLGDAAFALRPATPAEQSDFAAPASFWRITSGVTALLETRS